MTTRRGDPRQPLGVERELIEQLPEVGLGRIARPALQKLLGRVQTGLGGQMLPALRQIERLQPKTGQEDVRPAVVRVQAQGVLVVPQGFVEVPPCLGQLPVKLLHDREVARRLRRRLPQHLGQRVEVA